MTRVTVETPGSGRRFDGIGAVSAGASSRLLVDYPEPQRSEILDVLFRPGYGASLHHLKVEIGGDTNSTDGAEPSHARSPADRSYTRGYEWWLMREAAACNPSIVLQALCWGAPGWLGGGRFYSQDTCDYVADFVEGAAAVHGLQIGYVGVWNEMPADPEWIKRLRQTLRQRGLRTGIVAGEWKWEIVELLLADPELAASVDVVGVHYPRGYPGSPEAQALGKPLWAGEDGAWFDGAGDEGLADRSALRELAKLYNRNYLDNRLTATLVWSPVTAYYGNLPCPNSGLMRADEPWSGHYEVQPAVWVTAHTTQFTAPGWRYLDRACGDLPRGGSYVTLLVPDGAGCTIVVETMEASDVQPLEVAGVRLPLRVWRTAEGECFQALGELHGRLELLPGALYTISTTSGEAPRTTEPPASKPFPFPYREDFAGYANGVAPRYLADQEGAFEVHDGCLEQVVVQAPIPWATPFAGPEGPPPVPADNPNQPFTFAGGLDWRDYVVSLEAQVPDCGHVAVAGRVTRCPWRPGHPASEWAQPGRYELRLFSEGGFELAAVVPWGETVQLAAGGRDQGPEWRRLELAFSGDRISARLDGAKLATVRDSTFEAGPAGIATGWNEARFRAFEVRALKEGKA